MKVRQGWSGEVKPNVWARVDVELDEGDLRQLLIAAELPATMSLPVVVAFQILDAEAECLILAKLMTQHGYPEEEGRAKLTKLAQDKARIFDKLKTS